MKNCGGFMKRLFYILLLFFLLSFCLCSCKEQKEPSFLKNGGRFDTDVTVILGSARFDAHLFLDEKEARLTLKEGFYHGDLTFSLDREGRCFLCLEELTLPVTRERLPEKGLLLEALRFPDQPSFLKTRTTLEGQRVDLYSLVTPQGNLLFYTDGKGTLLRLVIEGAEPLTVLFKN
jgi:hypothetical protein